MSLTKVKAGNILLTTPAASSNDVTPATTQYVTTALANMVDSAPSTLNTLNELAAALGDDANFSTTVTNSIAAKLPLAGGSLTGNLDLAFDSNNSGNRLTIADTEGSSAAVRTYSTSDGTGLILNHYYAVAGSPYVRYSDFVSSMGDGAATNMRFLTKPHNGNPTVALTINQSQDATFAGNVGIGTASPSATLDITSTAQNVLDLETTNSDGPLQTFINSGTVRGYIGNAEGSMGLGTSNFAIRAQGSLHFGTNGNNERMRIDSNGMVLIGQDSGDAFNDDSMLRIQRAGDRVFQQFKCDADQNVQILFGDVDDDVECSIQYHPSDKDLRFSTGNNAEALRIDGSQRVGIGDTSPAGQLEVRNTTNQPTGIFAHEANNLGSYNDIVSSSTFTANSVNHQYFVCKSGNGSAISDIEFNLRGDGNAYADGSWSGGGADYAEYFEWADGNSSSQDRVGYSVSLVNNKIKIAESGETVIGVISGNPAVVGDNSWNSWKDKYQKDDYGRYIRNSDGHRISNPDYDDTLDYVKREDRKEWDIVGLMGKLRIKKGQQTGTNWIKMRDISDAVEEWLVR